MSEKKQSEIKPIEDFQVMKKAPHQSDFDEELKKQDHHEMTTAKARAETIDDDQPDFEKEDEYGQTRYHCWVIIQKGQRDLAETFFIEPTTGRKYKIDESPYYSVEAIFNHKNFWINLDIGRPLDEINFDFADDQTGEWEYVMI